MSNAHNADNFRYDVAVQRAKTSFHRPHHPKDKKPASQALKRHAERMSKLHA